MLYNCGHWKQYFYSDLVKHDHNVLLENCWMKTVTGEKAPILGKGKLQLSIGTLQVQHEMWVADITDDCILGTDFLQPYHLPC